MRYINLTTGIWMLMKDTAEKLNVLQLKGWDVVIEMFSILF